MSGRKKFVERLKNPHWSFLIVLYLATAALSVGAIVFAGREELTFPLSVAAYALYALSAISLTYSVYTIVKAVPVIKRKVVALLQKRRLTNKWLEQYGFRTAVTATVSFTINIAYVAFNGAIGVLSLSIWYLALAAYYLLLALMRGGVILFYLSKRRREESWTEKEKNLKEIAIYGRCGVGLIVLPLCLSFAILQMVRGVNSFEHAGLTIYVSAIYAFYKIVMSVVNVFKARKNADMTVRALRSINLADALVSVLALQTAMLKEFGGEVLSGTMNAITGAVVCALTVVLGVFMIVNADRKSRQRKEGAEDERTGR